MPYRIYVVSGCEYLFEVAEGKPREFYSVREGETIEIGRGPVAGIRIGINIARYQAALELRDNVVHILDFGSSRGPFERVVSVNGEFLAGDGTKWVPLTHGDQIQLLGKNGTGEATLKLEQWDDKD